MKSKRWDSNCRDLNPKDQGLGDLDPKVLDLRDLDPKVLDLRDLDPRDLKAQYPWDQKAQKARRALKVQTVPLAQVVLRVPTAPMAQVVQMAQSTPKFRWMKRILMIRFQKCSRNANVT